MKENTFIYLYHSSRAQYLVAYQNGKKVHTHLGEILLTNKIFFGKPVVSSTGTVFYVLKPGTSILSTKVIRKTTIIYPKEAGFILLELGIQSGSKVAEVGTGSGALTLILSNIVGENGKVYSFERREEFLELARENLDKFGKFNNVEFILKDVEREGFGNIKVDALFIDVPEPWEIVKHGWKILKSGFPLGSLSPNIEQIQKTYNEMEKTGFTRLRVYEILTREIMVRPEGTRPKERGITHTGYLLFGEKIEK